MADVTLTLRAIDEASGAFGAVSGVVKTVAGSLIEMTKQAAESERVGAQLSIVAGRLTDTFRAQATAISDQLGVDDEYIQQLQTLQLRYGVVPEHIEATTKATLDFAAATGQDAKGALEAMLRAAERGSDGVRSLGLVYQSTGDKTKDLAIATKMLEERWHDAAENAAQTAEGQWRKVQVQLDNVKESLGAIVLRANESTGALDNFSAGLTGLNHAIEKGTVGRFVGAGVGAIIGALFGDDETIARAKAQLNNATGDWQEEAQRAIEKVLGFKKSLKAADEGVVFDDGEVIEDRSFSERKAIAERAYAEMEKLDKAHAHNRMLIYEEAAKQEDDAMREWASRLADEARVTADDADERVKQRAAAQEEALRQWTKDLDSYISQSSQASRRLEAMQTEWNRAGVQMGAAVISGLGSQLKRLMQGGDFDIAAFFGSLFSSALGVLGGVLNFFAPGAGGIVSALGGLFRHDGGTIGYFHSGGMPATSSDERLVLAQEGEYMLSRQDVARMGGQAGVEAAKRGGGGGGTVIIQAVDAESVQRLMEGRGGRAAVNAVRLGRGGFSQLIRGRG